MEHAVEIDNIKKDLRITQDSVLLIHIFSGTVSNIQTGGNSVGFTTNRNVTLSPNKSVTITYSSLPFMTKTYQ